MPSQLRHISFMLALTLLGGCSLGLHATGSTVMLSGIRPPAPSSIEKVQIFLEQPKQPYEAVALVNSSIQIGGQGNFPEAEAAALEKLKQQAAAAGADGVIDVVREVVRGDTLISSTAFDTTTRLNGAPDLKTQQGTGYTSLSQTYSINYRGKAVKFKSD